MGSSDPPKSATRPKRNDWGDEDLAIRFVNTAAWRLRDPHEERLPDAGSLLDWARSNGIDPPRSLNAKAYRQQDNKRSKALYRNAIILREAIYEILVARMQGKRPPSDALTVFNSFLARSTPGTTLGWRSGELRWEMSSSADGDELFKPIVMSAAELMMGTRAGRVKQCQDERGCGWLFVDDSRAQNRRWCSMGDCGNRAKALRHYKRARA